MGARIFLCFITLKAKMYPGQGEIVSGHVLISWTQASYSACYFCDALRCVRLANQNMATHNRPVITIKAIKDKLNFGTRRSNISNNRKVSQIIEINKTSESEHPKLAQFDIIDGASIFAPKIITKKSDFGTLIWKGWQTNLLGGKTAIPSGTVVVFECRFLCFITFTWTRYKKIFVMIVSSYYRRS